MTDFQIRSDNVDVEQIMRQIRARIREKRGVDYTEEEITELARVKLEKFLDPTGVRSDLLAQFRRTKAEPDANPNYKFEDTTIFESHRGVVRFIRRLLLPVLKLFFNPNPIIDALHIQSDLNAKSFKREELQYELIHNLVLETTRLGIQVKNLRMQVESMSSRLDFDERRARALEGVVQYRPGAVPPLQPPAGAGPGPGRPAETEAQAQERRTRRRRRRGRRPGQGPGAGREAGGDSETASPEDREPVDRSVHQREAVVRVNGSGREPGERPQPMSAGGGDVPVAPSLDRARGGREPVERPKPMSGGSGGGG